MRVVQPEGTRGSLKWIQRLAHSQPEFFEQGLRLAGALPSDAAFKWLSPRKSDDWAEYRDGAFLDCLGLSSLRGELAEFWPRGGPQWDGLGRGSDGSIYLIEAKAHLGELASTCQAGPVSRNLIERSIASTREALGAKGRVDWLTGYYQYANRLAHLHFLRSRGAAARLIFLYFTGDLSMKGPDSVDEWKQNSASVLDQLGLSDVELQDVFDVHVDCRRLA